MHPLSPEFSRNLQDFLRARVVNLDEPVALAAQVKRLSDFYHANPGVPTPWSEPYAANAYLSYFLPLNFVRFRAAVHELKRFLPMGSFDSVWDFGAGIGTA